MLHLVVPTILGRRSFNNNKNKVRINSNFVGTVYLTVLMFCFFVVGCMYGPDPKLYEHLKEPQVNKIPAQKMVVVEVTGDPNLVGKNEIGALFRTYFKLKGIDKSKPVSLRARWPKPVTTPKSEWLGIWGLPVPDSVTELPAPKNNTNVKVQLTTWAYGDVAEILHYGPYIQETPTIDKLYKFIKDKGYEITGPHEEEYLKGPGMFGKGNPAKYLTIIRYNVRKK